MNHLFLVITRIKYHITFTNPSLFLLSVVTGIIIVIIILETEHLFQCRFTLYHAQSCYDIRIKFKKMTIILITHRISHLQDIFL